MACCMFGGGWLPVARGGAALRRHEFATLVEQATPRCSCHDAFGRGDVGAAGFGSFREGSRAASLCEVGRRVDVIVHCSTLDSVAFEAVQVVAAEREGAQ